MNALILFVAAPSATTFGGAMKAYKMADEGTTSVKAELG